ncbi:MAG: hypothetical protein ACK559_38630, partial [bacterium]
MAGGQRQGERGGAAAEVVVQAQLREGQGPRGGGLGHAGPRPQRAPQRAVGHRRPEGRPGVVGLEHGRGGQRARLLGQRGGAHLRPAAEGVGLGGAEDEGLGPGVAVLHLAAAGGRVGGRGGHEALGPLAAADLDLAVEADHHPGAGPGEG